jgi:signal recognition particle subunit SRP19
LKEYKRHVLWLDYFNSSITREQGRRIPLDRSVKDPKLGELIEAAQSLGYSPESSAAKHPKRMGTQTGYVSIEKKAGVKKSAVLLELAKSLSNVRGKRAEVSTIQKPQKGSRQQQRH